VAMIAFWAFVMMAGLVLVRVLWMWRAYLKLTRDNRARLSAGSSLLNTASGPVEYATSGEGFPVLVSHGGPADTTRAC